MQCSRAGASVTYLWLCIHALPRGCKNLNLTGGEVILALDRGGSLVGHCEDEYMQMNDSEYVFCCWSLVVLVMCQDDAEVVCCLGQVKSMIFLQRRDGIICMLSPTASVIVTGSIHGASALIAVIMRFNSLLR